MFASALAWSGVGLIAFVPLVGLAVLPLQLAALVVRGLVFEYLGMTALGAYVTLYAGHAKTRVHAWHAYRVGGVGASVIRFGSGATTGVAAGSMTCERSGGSAAAMFLVTTKHHWQPAGFICEHMRRRSNFVAGVGISGGGAPSFALNVRMPANGRRRATWPRRVGGRRSAAAASVRIHSLAAAFLRSARAARCPATRNRHAGHRPTGAPTTSPPVRQRQSMRPSFVMRQ